MDVASKKMVIDMFDRVRIVLIETSHPGNVGSTARAMKTMGFPHLILVNPKDYPHEKALEMASHASDVLERAQVVSTLDEALQDCQLIMGTSAREREIEWPVIEPREAALQAQQYLQTENTNIALLFGRERTGLLNEELQRCHVHIHIPTNPVYSSLNLASAVQLLCYELRLSFIKKNKIEKMDSIATDAQMQQFYEHLEQALYHVGYINPKAPKQAMSRLKRLFQRVRCEPEEVDLLRGICSKILRNHTGSPPSGG